MENKVAGKEIKIFLCPHALFLQAQLHSYFLDEAPWLQLDVSFSCSVLLGPWTAPNV